ncbi:MAG: tetratricopeptide repeat protein [Myxococcales bacterium]|nr:tetratricopeptide repeat protein [Myxococcales bacterium]MCB9752421.1 tetratricopeptide repeat protein [Myxococcales bacterium]
MSVSLIVSGAGIGTASAHVPVRGPLAVAAQEPSDDDAYEALTEEAAIRYEKKEYAAAVALFERAYEIRPEPNILFNVGRIHEEAGNLNDAIGYYERFIQDTSADYDARQAALKRLTLLRELVNIEKRPETPPDQQQPPPDQQQPPANVQQPPPDQQQPQNPPDDKTSPPPDPRKLRIVGYSLLGAGAVALIGGGIAAGIARNKHGQLDSAAPDIVLRRQLEADGINAARAADGMFIAGSILAAAGVVVLLLPQSRTPKEPKEKRTAFVPQFSAREVGVGLVGRF